MTCDLSIVIVTWNVVDYVLDCLKSIILNTPDSLDYEIIVVDNASSDNTASVINNEFPSVILIPNSTNIGFARGNNQAIRVAKGRNILFLNPDTILHENAIEVMLDFLNKNEDVGLVGPKLVDENGSIQLACARKFPSLLFRLTCDVMSLSSLPIIGEQLKKHLQYPYDYSLSQEVEAISGACMLARDQVINTIGGFGEEYIHGGEDLELCLRVKRAGWKNYYLQEAIVTHFGGRSSRQARFRVFVNSVLSDQKFYIRSFGRMQGILYRLIIQLIGIPCIMVIGFVKFLVGLETLQDYRHRLKLVRGLLQWKAI